MRKQIIIYELIIAVLCLLVACDSNHATRNLIVITGFTMGTKYTVKINEPRINTDSNKIKTEIDNILKRLNDSMSTYIETSELSQINKSRQTDWIPVSNDLLTVIEQATVISKLTEGAFDITVGPIVNLWGFGPGPQPDNIPEDNQINTVLERVGYHLLQIRHDPPSIRKNHADLYIDLSGIAKGYAVDVLAEFLEGYGIRNYLVEIGGELRANGNNPDSNFWRIGIEKPITNGRMIQRVIMLDDTSMATSGDYRNYIEKENTRYSHTIVPNTGRPISHRLASVTVIAPSAMYTDALATALMVLGPDKGYRLAEDENIAALFIVKTDDGFTELYTRASKDYMIE